MSTRIPNNPHGTAVSYAYTVKANGKIVGTLQGFNPSANRPLERVRELQNEEIDCVEIVPGRTDFTISVDRLETYDNAMMQALGYATVEDISRITDPILITEELRNALGRVRKIEYHNCWVTSWSKTVTEGTITVRENVNMWCETIRVAQQ
jgi:hypothetical protein